MLNVTQTTAASAEQSGAAAEELTAQSRTLKEVADRLTAMVGGGERTASRRTASATELARPVTLATRHRFAASRPRNLLLWVRPSQASHEAGQPKETVALRPKFEQNSIPLDEGL
jgi:hypothetical protein